MINPTDLVRGKLNCCEKETSQCDARFKRQACFSFSLQARADILSWKVAVFHTGIQEPGLFCLVSLPFLRVPLLKGLFYKEGSLYQNVNQ